MRPYDEPRHRQGDPDEDFRPKRSYIANLRDETLTINKLAVLFGLFVLANQGLNAVRERIADPKQLVRLEARVEAIAEQVKDLNDKFEKKAEDDIFFNAAVCQQLKRNSPTRYPSYCEKPEITRFDFDRVVIPSVPPR